MSYKGAAMKVFSAHMPVFWSSQSRFLDEIPEQASPIPETSSNAAFCFAGKRYFDKITET